MNHQQVQRLRDHLAAVAAGQMHHQDGTLVEAAAVGCARSLRRPVLSSLPHEGAPGVVGREDESCVVRRRRGLEDAAQFAQSLIGEREVVQIGAAID